MQQPTIWYLARFTPQAWINDHAVDVDPEGMTYWDITDHIRPLIERGDDLLTIEEGDTESLIDVGQPPQWARDWTGPFRVAVLEITDSAMAAKLLGLPDISWLAGRPDRDCDPDCTRREQPAAACDCSRSTTASPATSLRCSCPSGDGSLAWPCPSHPPSVTDLTRKIPDADGRYGRGYRDALESLALAIGATGKLNAVEMATVVQSALDAYGNHDQRDPKGYEVDESLVVSTAHLTAQERAALLEGELPDNDGQFTVVSMTSQYGALLYLSTPDDELQLPTYGISEGLLGVIEQARKLGAAYVRFDRDAFVLAGVPTYDD